MDELLSGKASLLFQPAEIFQRRWKLTAQTLRADLDFHDQDSRYGSHNFHAFPAKFPPQLPRLFIEQLTRPGDVVLDPMQGSGTTTLEAALAGRKALGFDIDPLSLLITKVKTTPLDPTRVLTTGKAILKRAAALYDQRSKALIEDRKHRWDPQTRKFIDYWFDLDTQFALLALLREIEVMDDPGMRNFFYLAFSAIIITKSGGVSLALDLAHTRPHRAKLIYSPNGENIEGQQELDAPSPNLRYTTKVLRSPLNEFAKRVENNVKGLLKEEQLTQPIVTGFGDAQRLPIPNNCVDLIVTSPPYASNAIDYMRAHKFSLAWLGYPIESLSSKRSEYIGGETVTGFPLEPLPDYAQGVVADISKLDQKKGLVLHRYYSEMTRVLREMQRVLKPGGAAILVVGSSALRGRDSETQTCLAEIGRSLSLMNPGIGVRNLDRDRRMLPAGARINPRSQIQQRMHQEYVIIFFKTN